MTLQLSAAWGASEVGETTIAKWQDDKKAVFLLVFDDGWPSHWQIALPAMTERGLMGTFYVCPGKGEFVKFKDKWAKDVVAEGMVLGDHTMTHQGVRDFADADAEIGGASKVILEMTTEKKPTLVFFGMPGVPPGRWNIPSDQYKELLNKYRLIDRPTFAGHGAVYHLQKADQMLALADRAIAQGEMGYVVFHGLERRGINWGYEDMWPLNYDIFITVLDGLKTRQENGDLWVIDHISWHRYKAQRENAKVKVRHANTKEISIELNCSIDQELYDLPLTLITPLPPDWKSASVTQNDKPAKTVRMEQGNISYKAVPNSGPIMITRKD